MKNRNDGGYSLALVLVVMAVLAVIATSLVTVVLRNMDSQHDYTERVQNQYEAQGKLEKVLAELSENIVVDLQTTLNSQGDDRKKAIQTAIEAACGTEVSCSAQDENTLKYWFIGTNNIKEEYGSFAVIPATQTMFSYDFTLTANSNEVEVTYTVRLEGNISYSDHTEGDFKGTTMFIITSPQITMESVEVGGVA